MRTVIIIVLIAGALYFFLHDSRPNVRKDIRAAQKTWERSELKKFFD